MILRVGLTGGIGSGKSTVARLLENEGCDVIDSDRIVGELYAPGEAGWRAIRDEYGEQVLAADGTIDRAKLSTAALETPEGAARLNSLIHPLVIERQSEWLASLEADGGDHVAVIEATLLLESGGAARVEKIVVVSAAESLQVQRAAARGLPEGEVRRRISRQMGSREREKAADYVVRNDGSLDELQQRVSELAAALRRDLEKKKAPPAQPAGPELQNR